MGRRVPSRKSWEQRANEAHHDNASLRSRLYAIEDAAAPILREAEKGSGVAEVLIKRRHIKRLKEALEKTE